MVGGAAADVIGCGGIGSGAASFTITVGMGIAAVDSRSVSAPTFSDVWVRGLGIIRNWCSGVDYLRYSESWKAICSVEYVQNPHIFLVVGASNLASHSG